jgi:hypothetical protein
MTETKNKDNRATVEAARRTGKSTIIASIIGAAAIIIVASISIFYSGNEFQKTENNKLKITDTLEIVDTSKNIIPKVETHQGNVIKKNYSTELSKIDNLIDNQQYAQAYRVCLNLYDSLPEKTKNGVNIEKIKEAKKAYDNGNWKEASIVMKECINFLNNN